MCNSISGRKAIFNGTPPISCPWWWAFWIICIYICIYKYVRIYIDINICIILFQEEKLFLAEDPRSVAPGDDDFGLICVHICVYKYVRIYIYIRIHIMYKYIYFRKKSCVPQEIPMSCPWWLEHMGSHVYIYVYTNMYIYKYVHTNLYMHTHIYVYTCIIYIQIYFRKKCCFRMETPDQLPLVTS